METPCGQLTNQRFTLRRSDKGPAAVPKVIPARSATTPSAALVLSIFQKACYREPPADETAERSSARAPESKFVIP